MNKKNVYLCGQITGATYTEARFGWREQVYNALDERHGGPEDVRCLSPMRNKEHLSDDKALSPLGKLDSVLSCPRGITTRDRWDVQRSTLIFANLDMTKISVGCMIELGWADILRIPVLAIMPEGSLHDHAMVRELIGWRCQTLEEGIGIAHSLLNEVL